MSAEEDSPDAEEPADDEDEEVGTDRLFLFCLGGFLGFGGVFVCTHGYRTGFSALPRTSSSMETPLTFSTL